MNKILLLMACAVTLVAAGRTTVNPGTVQGIGRMSLGELQRQRFILDIVQNIQEPLQNDELIRLDQGLIVEPQRYRGGIDGEMQHVIDLDRQRRLLDEHQSFSVLRVEDVQQLRGIYRLLVRAIDFETLQRNVVYLRRNINPVLLINALARAIQDRDDTQTLVVPGVQELLPELYVEPQVVEHVRRIQQEQTQRPSLIDVVGLGHRPMNPIMNILNPWREMRMQMALIRQQGQKSRLSQLGMNRVVIPIDGQGQGQEQGQGISLLTDDIGLRNFVQNLIQELALLEGEDEAESQRIPLSQEMEQERDEGINTGRLLYVNRRRLQQQQQEDQQESINGNERERFMRVLRRNNNDNNDNDDDDDVNEIRMGRVPLQRGVGQGNIYLGSHQGGGIDLPTVNADSDRLLYVNRRRMNSIQQEQGQQTGGQRYPGLVRGSRYSEGRRVVDQQGQQDQMQQRYGNQESAGVDRTHSLADQLESVSRDDERLVHINRRRLNQIGVGVGQQQKMMPRRVASIGEVRQVLDRPIQDEDIVKFIRGENRLSIMSDDEILAMLKRNREKRLQKLQNNNDNDNDVDNDQQQVQGWAVEEQGQRIRRSLSGISYRQQQGQDLNSRRSEILLHNLRQLVARLNQESIAQGQTIDNKNLWLNDQRQTQSERYALRLNQIRIDSLRNRQLLEQINKIEQRMQQAIGQLNIQSIRGQFQEQRQVEALIADVLLGRLGQVGILRIVRELIQENEQQIDRSGLGIRLSDPLVQYTLRRIVSVVDDQREQLLGGYRRNQLAMQGVSINDVRVDKLRTRIEETDMDLTNLIGQHQQQGRPTQQQMQQTIVGRQRRLNNKPFLIDMEISSEQSQDVVIRVFLGLSQDSQGREASLDERRRDFVLLDAINVELQSGTNRIQKRSIDIPWTSRDVTPLSEIYRRVMMQLRGQQELDTQELVGENGRFPQRLLLPRGRPQGLPMQLLVVVSPVLEQQQKRIIPSISLGIGSASLQDIRSLGYPLDRPISDEQELLQLPNVHLQDVVIVQEN